MKEGQGRQGSQTVIGDVAVEVALFKSIGIQFLAIFCQSPGLYLQPLQAPVEFGYSACRWHGNRRSSGPAMHIDIPDMLSLEKITSQLVPTEVCNHVPEALLGQLVTNVFHGGIVGGHDGYTRLRETDDVCHQVEDCLCLSRTRWSIDHGDAVGETLLECFPLAEVRREGENVVSNPYFRVGRMPSKLQVEDAFRGDRAKVRIRTTQWIVLRQMGHDVVPVVQDFGCFRPRVGADKGDFFLTACPIAFACPAWEKSPPPCPGGSAEAQQVGDSMDGLAVETYRGPVVNVGADGVAEDRDVPCRVSVRARAAGRAERYADDAPVDSVIHHFRGFVLQTWLVPATDQDRLVAWIDHHIPPTELFAPLRSDVTELQGTIHPHGRPLRAQAQIAEPLRQGWT